ncbi:hypothetical protein Dde_2824 [Oleidesulfovibrio alaskensis G20]|uniref:Lipoprotein n=1 Tax=Oleidesulfovibrio alaskensis (strain ATCC BAA-1058 / DSM 17464 / G20) TaxID=207559 RepID=Q30XH7_OLEA2|nr:hypothetical protein [Oleidesulfovibrio alaskensis]ABB39619.2 hypothetical protein Dde_2824 [Oleidesulfovibrio alaskensis G20]MBG0774007.1 hypothetical protein [Oleidesulfovibrio alaskensis]MBL3582277.1 hypothetical protein [Oleidesulfovibrio alaskensis]
MRTRRRMNRDDRQQIYRWVTRAVMGCLILALAAGCFSSRSDNSKLVHGMPVAAMSALQSPQTNF